MIKFIKAFSPIAACWLLVGLGLSMVFNDYIILYAMIAASLIIAAGVSGVLGVCWWVTYVYESK